MRTYAEYLNTMTVKTLNSVARDMGLKGYSKMRKAELVAFIDDAIVNDCVMVTADYLHFAQFGVWPAEVKILDVEAPTDQPKIAAIMRKVAAAPVTFSAAPVKAPESAPAATDEADAQDSDPSEILFAYRAMRATFRKATGSTQVKLAARLRVLGAQLRAYGYNMRTV